MVLVSSCARPTSKLEGGSEWHTRPGRSQERNSEMTKLYLRVPSRKTESLGELLVVCRNRCRSTLIAALGDVAWLIESEYPPEEIHSRNLSKKREWMRLSEWATQLDGTGWR